MAAAEASPRTKSVSFGSHDTALCIFPPRHLWGSIDRLRMLYDKAFEKWPPHVNLIYPFVGVESLPAASDLIISHFQSKRAAADYEELRVRLDCVGVFPHRQDNTISICEKEEENQTMLEETRKGIMEALGQKPTPCRMHMTLGQSQDHNSFPHKSLLHKASLLPAIEWEVNELCILVRERTHINDNASSEMKLWGTIELKNLSISRITTPVGLYPADKEQIHRHNDDEMGTESCSLSWRPYVFSNESFRLYTTPDQRKPSPDSLKLASYNVLAEFHHPPSQSRYALILKNLQEHSALSDVLVLQEVTDDFLCYLLRDGNIRGLYPFVSNGPPDQSDVDPLPSHLNVVVLSKWSFSWDWVSFRRHKGFIVIKFDDIGKAEGDSFIPLILAAAHLACGLTDGSVAAKKTELQSILSYLSNNYPQNPWVLAGDLNITTSAYTIEAALKKKAITPQTAKYLVDLEEMLTESGLEDSWVVARLDNLDSTELEESRQHLQEAFEGEQGATFDPTVNELAARIVGSRFNNRPQRYDRILVKAPDLFFVGGFNMFGFSRCEEDETAPENTYASDHWGVRCSLKCTAGTSELAEETSKLLVPVHLKSASESLSDMSNLKSCLVDCNVFPSNADITKGQQALQILQDAIMGTDRDRAASQARSKLSLVFVPVGSYGLGVWTSSSDIDCLCIGPVSSKTFFSLAVQRLRKAASKGVGIRVLRRVNAHSGSMLELEIQGIKMDLQYCPSAWIAETWPQALRIPANNPAWILPTQILSKLKPTRDLHYLRRTLPDLAAFRIVYHLIKTWAKRRGIYEARFGYLGGIHISIMLSRVCKLLARDARSVSVPDIISTFFNHYAQFDWKKDMVFDPFFHKRLRYVRTAREPMIILGIHAPGLNVAHSASLPSVRTINEEFRRADRLLSDDGMTWSRFLGDIDNSTAHRLEDGASDFLKAYKSYVRIDVQFWGTSLGKGSQFVGWLESRCVMLLVDLNRRLPKIHARIWPVRFVGQESSSYQEEKEYQGYYLIGLDEWETANGQEMTKDDLKLALGSLQTVLQIFEGQIRGDEKYFDSKTSWMSASVVKQSELGSLRLDGREWGEYTIGQDESESDDDSDEDHTTRDDDSEAETSTTKNSKKVPKNAVISPVYEGKLRTSADVMNRLRWDPSLNSSDYLVGYLDRFLGVKERSLDSWKTEQSDEEFIPQHRILYFKQRSDGVVVWDRKARRDDIFGSGVKD
ncbi:uncharacterized protein BCR38DRAFT_367805 [Pseudomassariella vexata]|uniref:polynucleotide adenylyltransferase n=1 Tax=Pseudomassariella vexata TaxID=1141098 RepID=A0A1Y2E0A1_9PEZI|nr:uncharacterized protein BCR38DRAFT_367805 [Pseudomassariella vexata]ORY64963.1 hypothetical protein BCR38DRAFT_367805 [Pseudomassariella vexata]